MHHILYIRENVLGQITLHNLKTVMEYAREQLEEFYIMAMQNSEAEGKKFHKTAKQKKSQIESRIRHPNCCKYSFVESKYTRSQKSIRVLVEILSLSIMHSDCRSRTGCPRWQFLHAPQQRLLKKQYPEDILPSGYILHKFSVNDLSQSWMVFSFWIGRRVSG